MSIGNSTEKVVDIFLTSGSEAEQGYKACASLTKLADRYGHDRLENACRRSLELTKVPSVRIISSMLKNGQDRIKPEQPPVHKATQSQELLEVPLTLRKGVTANASGKYT